MSTPVTANTTWENLCSSCKTKSCCKSFSGANLLQSELEKIKDYVGNDSFAKIVTYNKIPTPVIQKKSDSDECIFWDSKNDCCSIYDLRPFDCKLFPFDIHKINGQNMWVINTCNPDADWSWTESMLQEFENDPSFSELVENLNSYSYPESTNNKLYDVTILRPVNIKS